jgi:hypothetical protein
MKKEYQVIRADANPYDMGEWKIIMMTEREAEKMRKRGYLCVSFSVSFSE